MATPEATPSPKEMLLPVSVEEFFKWDDLEEIHLSDLEDSSSAGWRHNRKRNEPYPVTGAHEFQQDSPGSFPKLSLMECSRHS